MLGAPARTNVANAWGERPSADHAPTLAPAPEGLSARRVERWLDLPPGAWQRRHLYALRVKGQTFGFLGLRPSDLVIVEPGAREQPGRIVVTRSPQGPSLKKIPLPAPIERRMPTVLELPLRERNFGHAEHVVGTVIGLLRATGTGALRPVSLAPSRSGAGPRPRTGPRRAMGAADALRLESSSPAEPVSVDHLFQTQRQWHDWLASSRESDVRPPTPAQLERWERLDASLATLCDCLAHTHSAGLRSALAAEAFAIVTSIRTEMRG